MRAILTLALLVVSLKGAVPEVKYQDQLAVKGDRSALYDLSLNLHTAVTLRQLVLASPQASADTPHRQGEDNTGAPQPSPPAATDVDAEKLPPDSTDTLCKALLASAEHNDLPVTFFANLIWQESRFQHDAVSSAGALGIAQFMPEVAMEVGLGNPFDPHEAIPASAKLLHGLHEQFGNLGFAAAAYNAGPHRVAEWLEHGRTLPRETQVYVMRVTGRSAEAWRKSPPTDSQVGFVRLLPCRGLPAFAGLERAHWREAQVAERERQVRRQEIAMADLKTANAPAVHHRARMFRPSMARRVDVERHVAVISHPVSADRIARNFRVERLEAVHRPHIARDKRRVA
jgi:Transglycosylase SLT domain